MSEILYNFDTDSLLIILPIQMQKRDLSRAYHLYG